MGWGELAPRFEWRASQRHLLDVVGRLDGEGDRRWHLCAPPGAGKTLIGLELARRVGRPTLVLAPTTAIREQWQAATALFGADPEVFTSDDPAVPAALLTVTYQLLGNPGDAARDLRAAARRLWVAEVAAEAGRDPDAAERRVAVTERADRPRARRELQRHVRALRRSLSGAEDVGLDRATLLGARPLALIERFAALGIGCVVLDECHHLLDWWALVVSALLDRLAPVTLVGFTATLPDPGSSREAENYTGLLGEVDAELQLAAMVAEGTVAPWRDGVRLAHVTEPEARFLDDWADRFASDLDARLVDETFVTWAVTQVTEAAFDARTPDNAPVGEGRVGGAVGEAGVGDAMIGAAPGWDATVGNAPGWDATVGNAPGWDTRVGDAPVGEGRVGDATVGEGRVGDATVGEGRVGGAPVGEGRADNAMVGEVGVGEGRADNAMVGEVGVGEGTVGEAGVGDAMIGAAPGWDAMIGEAPVGGGRVGEAPVGGGRVGEAAGWDATVGEGRVGDVVGWDGFWDRDPLAAQALGRWWTIRGLGLPAGFDPPPQAELDAPPTLDDRLTLLHAWLHDPAAEVDATTRRDIARLTGRYGVAFTTAGIRWNRSVADLVCSLSSSKGAAAADVLAEEARRRGEALRGVVVVERDVATTPSAAVREVLGEDAGTAARVMAALCARGEVADLGVLLVTGRGAWCDALGAEGVAAAVNVGPAATEGRWLEVEGCDIPGAVRLAGRGGRGGWTSAEWLATARTAFTAGAARVLVATRGLVGEGWDERSLNVLVDLSDAASSTASTQLRGRALRLDPADPGKLASLWDVAVVHPAAPGDWQRLRRRHAHWWGPDGQGRVTTGPAKLHPLVFRPELPSPEEVDEINAGSAAAVADREAAREAWARVDPDGVAAAVVHVPARRRRRVRTRSAGWRWQTGASAAGAAVGGGLVLAVALALWPALAVAGVGLVAGLVVAVRGRERDERTTLLAVAEAVTAGLVAAGRDDLAAARTVVEPDPAGGGWHALVDGVGDDSAAVWADAMAEVVGPLGTPRWMVAIGGPRAAAGNRDSRDAAWRVPSAVGATRQAAEAFAAALRRRVPSARLVRAGTPRATELVLAAASRRPDHIERSLHWRHSTNH